MKKKNKAATKGIINILPEEILENILTRLPVKTIVRFSSVCKSWYNLFRTPYFINLHSKNNPSNSNNLLLVHQRCKQLLVMDTSSSSIHSRLIHSKIDDFRDSERTIVGCSNGIVCIHDIRLLMFNEEINEGNLNEDFCLWNPALNIIKNFSIQPFTYDEWDQLFLGFGFDNVCSDYKVLRFTMELPLDDLGFENLSHPLSLIVQSVTHVEIYSLSSDSWRIVEVAPHSITNFISSYWTNTGVYINGAHHWLVKFARKIGNKYTRGIISFDMGEEVFKEIKIPDECERMKKCSVLFNYYDSLAMLVTFSSSRDHSSYIWVIKDYGSPESWIKICKIDIPLQLSRVRFMEFFPLENAVIISRVEHQGDLILLYIDKPHEKHASNSVANIETLKDVYEVKTYRESLMLIKNKFISHQ